jgi:hypothetical protein
LKKNNWLEEFNSKTYSQHGEDSRIDKILEVIGDTDRWCVEFGAWDGKYNSNTYNLIKNKNYQAVLIEGSASKFTELTKNMEGLPVTPVHAFVGFDEATGLDKILTKTKIPLNFDVLSIDIDGNDYHTWAAVKKFRPKLVVIEFNPTIPNEVEFVQEPVTHLNYGCSVKALVKLAKTKGYELVSCTLNNAFFVDNQYFKKFEISDNSVDKLRTELSRVTYIFSGYDGTVFMRGFGKLDLHGLPFKEKNFQLLPKFLRGYDDSGAGSLGYAKKLIRKTYKSILKRI